MQGFSALRNIIRTLQVPLFFYNQTKIKIKFVFLNWIQRATTSPKRIFAGQALYRQEYQSQPVHK